MLPSLGDPPAAAAAAAAAADPPPFSGPDTPSASNMLSRRMIWGSGGSSSCTPLMLSTAEDKTRVNQMESFQKPVTSHDVELRVLLFSMPHTLLN